MIARKILHHKFIRWSERDNQTDFLLLFTCGSPKPCHIFFSRKVCFYRKIILFLDYAFLCRIERLLFDRGALYSPLLQVAFSLLLRLSCLLGWNSCQFWKHSPIKAPGVAHKISKVIECTLKPTLLCNIPDT